MYDIFVNMNIGMCLYVSLDFFYSNDLIYCFDIIKDN